MAEIRLLSQVTQSLAILEKKWLKITKKVKFVKRAFIGAHGGKDQAREISSPGSDMLREPEAYLGSQFHWGSNTVYLLHILSAIN